MEWFGRGAAVDMSPDSRQLAYYLDGASQQDSDFYVMINVHWEDAQFRIQKFRPRSWKVAVDTARQSPQDICEPGQGTPVMGPNYTVRGRSIVVLIRDRGASGRR